MTLSVKISDEQAKHLRQLSHYLSLERESDLSLSDLVREALNRSFPMPKSTNDEREEDDA